MHGLHYLEYRCGFIAANSADLSLSSSWRENSLLQVFAVANRGFVARGHRLARLFAAGIPRADRYCRSVERVGVVGLRQVVSHWARRPSGAAFRVGAIRRQAIVITPRRALHDELSLLTGLVVDRDPRNGVG